MFGFSTRAWRPRALGRVWTRGGAALVGVALFGVSLFGVAAALRAQAPALTYPPALPSGQTVVTDRDDAFLKPLKPLREGVKIARAAPTIDFLYYPGQDYPGKPWSAWGDACAAGDNYYSAIGDHLAPRGSARLYAYDAAAKKTRLLVDLKSFLETSGALPADMNYTPGKVHSRVDLGSDGWLYYAGHRGSTRTTSDKFGFRGEWIYRTHPETGQTEIVAAHPVEKHVIPCSLLDPKRLIFYGGTAPGDDAPQQGVVFFAFDVGQRRLLRQQSNGPARCMFLAASTGKLYFVPGGEGPAGPLMRFDPAAGKPPEPVGGDIGLRAATEETPQGLVYTVSKDEAGTLWSFNTRTEKIERLDTLAVGEQSYIATLDADPTGRYLYYSAGAHGGGADEGAPVVCYDVASKTKTVIAFLHPFYHRKYGYTPDGTFTAAVSGGGDKLFITWNGTRHPRPQRAKTWESCALTVIHLPPREER